MSKILNIVIPMAGKGSRFQDAGYTFPKPLIDIMDQTMIEVVVKNLKPRCRHRFIFIVQKEHYEKYDLYHVLQNATDNKFEIIQIDGVTEGAACTVLGLPGQGEVLSRNGLPGRFPLQQDPRTPEHPDKKTDYRQGGPGAYRQVDGDVQAVHPEHRGEDPAQKHDIAR